MSIFSWFTFDKKDEYGRYIGSILYGKECGFRKCYEHYKPNFKGGCVPRKELDNQPILPGYCGPMWDGDGLRYETQEIYDLLST